MSTKPETVSHILDTLAALPGLRVGKMFGEYGLWIGARCVALICDDTLYAKATPSAHALLPGVRMGPPYPGAKPHMVLDEMLDDADLAVQVLRAVAADTAEPKPKKPKASKAVK